MEVYPRMEHSDEKEQRQQRSTKEGKTAAVPAKLTDDLAPVATGIPARKEQLQNGTVREDY